MPLTEKGKKILASMKSQYGEKKGEKVFYASQNKGTIKGTHKAKRTYKKGSPNTAVGSHCLKSVGALS